jgi:chromosome segregation ATPase
MATLEVDLGKILERIDARLERLEAGQGNLKTAIATLDQKVTDTGKRLERLEAGQGDLKTAIATLDQKVTDTGKRLDSLETRVGSLTGWIIGILFALVGGLLGLLGKVTFFPNP